MWLTTLIDLLHRNLCTNFLVYNIWVSSSVLRFLGISHDSNSLHGGFSKEPLPYRLTIGLIRDSCQWPSSSLWVESAYWVVIRICYVTFCCAASAHWWFFLSLFFYTTVGLDEFIKFVKPAPIDEAPTKKQKKQMAGQKKTADTQAQTKPE